MASQLYSGTHAVDSTEWSCTTDTSGPDADTTPGELVLVLDVNDMVAGDVLQIRVYEKARSGDTQRLCQEWILSGAQTSPLWMSPDVPLLFGWDYTLKTLAGTSITVLWSIRYTIAVQAVTVTSGGITSASFAAGAINAAAIAADAITDAKVASDVTIASVTGAVGSVTGHVGGNVTGTIGSLAAQAKLDVNAEADTAISDAALATAANLGTVAGYLDTEVAAILAAVDTEVTAIKSKTDSLMFTEAGKVDSNVLTLNAAAVQAIWDALTSALTTVGSIGKKLGDLTLGTAQTGDSFARLGAPAGASVSADLVAIKGDSAAILLDTGTDGVVMTAAGLASDAVTEIQAGLATAAVLATVAGYIDTEVAAIKTETDKIPLTITKVDAIKATTDLLPNAGALTSLATAAALDTVDNFLDTEIAAIKAVTDLLPNGGALSGLATATALDTVDNFLDTEVTAIKAVVDAIQAKTDSLTFTVAGQADANIKSVTDDLLTGSGIPNTDEWRPL